MINPPYEEVLGVTVYIHQDLTITKYNRRILGQKLSSSKASCGYLGLEVLPKSGFDLQNLSGVKGIETIRNVQSNVFIYRGFCLQVWVRCFYTSLEPCDARFLYGYLQVSFQKMPLHPSHLPAHRGFAASPGLVVGVAPSLGPRARTEQA